MRHDLFKYWKGAMLTALAVGGGWTAGCGTGAFMLVPFAMIQYQQLTDQPNFTVSLDARSAVSDPTKVTQVNWVFGDGSGFEASGLQTQHQYQTAGAFTVTAFFFDSNGLVDSVTTTITIAVPNKASGPTPNTGARNIPTSSALGWTPGNGASRSIVYLSTDGAAVAAAGTETAQAEISGRTFAPAHLDGGTQYFWRIDSITPSGNVVGDVWNFQTAGLSDAISGVSPADNAEGVALNVSLKWTAGVGATSHDVYFGTDAMAVANASRSGAEFKGNQTDTEFKPASSLEVGKFYFWRVDEVGPGGTRKGAVLHFRTADVPTQITDPHPFDAAVDVRVDAELSWMAGVGVKSHDVYFGTARDAVESADSTVAVFRGNQSDTTFKPALTANTTYFWRIDEIGPGGKTKGVVNQFKTAEAPTQASEFSPKDTEIEIAVQPMLKWKTGQHVEQHLVFFGKSRDGVTAAGVNDTTGILAATLDVGAETFDPASANPLEMNLDYFWRIDERGAGGVTRGPVLTFKTRNPIRAGDPSPAHDEEDVAIATDLMWSAGDQAGPPLSHDVYLGTSEISVTNATNASAEFQGNFPAGVEMFDPLNDLERNTDYYWRVDERYDATKAGVDTEIAKGKIWHFKTVEVAPEKAKDPNPADGSIDLDLNADLSWTAGNGAKSHDVYFGTNQSVVMSAMRTTAGVFKGNFQGTSFALPKLASATDYYWRIDEVNNVGMTAGDVWHFKTAGLPDMISDPLPADGAVDQSVNVPLSWTAGMNAASHDVYFGTSMSAVMNATKASAAFKGNQASTTFSPGALMPSMIYYWRIDEVNDAGTTTGAVMSFATGNRPTKASNPNPVTNAVNVAIEPTLTWTPGTGGAVITHDVYFGTGEADVSAATRIDARSVFKGNQSNAFYVPEALTPDTQYYWRIDEVGTGDTRKGDVWQFRTAAAPTKATLVAGNGDGPAHNSIDVLLKPVLKWTPGAGSGTITHDVYFGTSQSGVQSATRTDAVFKQTQSGNTYMPGNPVALTSATRYYWRIDTVDSLGGTTKGDVWQFDTTAATQLVIVNPSDRPVGMPASVQIQARTDSNLLVNTLNASVTLNVSGSAMPSGVVALVNGQATVMVTDTVPETVQLTLVDSAATGLNVSSTQDVVFWGTVASFLVEREGGGLIPTQNANVAFNLRMTARDSANQIVQDYNASVDLTSTISFFGGPTLTTPALVNGVRAAQAFTFTATGTSVTITATQTGGGASGTSNAFRVDP